ncbi:MAG: hypothetical protein ACF8XB_16715 [Planctomycetota bacterium JB042]
MNLAALFATTVLLVPAARAGDEAPPPNVRHLRHDLAVAEQKLAQAKVDAEVSRLSALAGVEHAATELELAKARLEDFVELDAVHRRTKAELELRQVKDRATEAADELKQIELMYREQDLNDLTAEFVVARGRRNAERASARIDLQASEFDALVNHTLPLERKKLALDLDRKRFALEKAKLEAQSGELGREIALMKAREEVVRLREKIAAAEVPAAEREETGGAAETTPAPATSPAGEAREW